MQLAARTHCERDGGKVMHCEREGCSEYPMMFVNGQVLLCWDHYCELMKEQRETSADKGREQR
jgi:hypothetical protein